MSKFELKNYIVQESRFIENPDCEKKNSVEVKVDGELFIPKDITADSEVAVTSTFHLGNENERIFMMIKVFATFVVKDSENVTLSENLVKSECVPVVVGRLKTTIADVMKAYGRKPIEIPPFEEVTADECE